MKEMKNMSKTIEHAKHELELMGYDLNDTEDGANKWMVDNVLELMETFSKQGHSGFSAPQCIGLFTKLANFEALSPLTGKDDEWVDVSSSGIEPAWQNRRATHVFKNSDGYAFDINGKVFVNDDGTSYTSSESKIAVTFPYTPKIEYINVKDNNS